MNGVDAARPRTPRIILVAIGLPVPLTYVAMVLAILLIIAIAMILAMMFSPSS